MYRMDVLAARPMDAIWRKVRPQSFLTTVRRAELAIL